MEPDLVNASVGKRKSTPYKIVHKAVSPVGSGFFIWLFRPNRICRTRFQILIGGSDLIGIYTKTWLNRFVGFSFDRSWIAINLIFVGWVEVRNPTF